MLNLISKKENELSNKDKKIKKINATKINKNMCGEWVKYTYKATKIANV